VGIVKVASWNINSVRARLANIKEWLSQRDPDVVLFQEIKCINDDFPLKEFESSGYNVAVNGQKSYNGVAIIAKFPITKIKNNLPTYPQDTQSRYIEAVINGVTIASIYLPNGNPITTEKYSYKLEWMKKLKDHSVHLMDTETPIVLGGDFNVIPSDEDVHDPDLWTNDALCQLSTRQHFREILNLGYTDAFRMFNTAPNRYTFWDYQGGAWQKDHGVRIDHFLLSPQAADICRNCTIDTSPRGMSKASDHTPIIIDLELE
tara:strand:+ start:1473 stop:2255 length:783 start_codon:yes stop_codon:yes gene_type:complete